MARNVLVPIALGLMMVAPLGAGITSNSNHTRADPSGVLADAHIGIGSDVPVPDVQRTPNGTAPLPPPGLGDLDPWIDATGDEMFGDLDMGGNAIQFAQGNLDTAIAGQGLRFNGQRVCTAALAGIMGCGGDISAVNAGFGITGGGAIGDVTVAVNDLIIQRRVTGACATGSSIRSIDQLGAVVCEDDTDTTYSAGDGLLLSGTSFSADTAYLQRRVGSSCPAGESIRAIAADGGVTCEVDTDTDTLGGLSCTADEIAKWDGSAWACAPDDAAATVYTAGSGLQLVGDEFSIATNGVDSSHILDGGVGEDDIDNFAVTGFKLADDAVTSAKIADGSVSSVDVDSSLVQLRVSSSCALGEAIRLVNEDGTVLCEADDDTTYTAGDGLALVGTEFRLVDCDIDYILRKGIDDLWTCFPDDVNGGDATTLDLVDSTSFLRSDESDTFGTGTLTLASGTTLRIDGQVNIGADDATNDELTFSDGLARLQWDETDSRFELSADTLVEGELTQTGVDLHIGDGVEQTQRYCFYEDGFACGTSLRWDDGQDRLELPEEVAVTGPLNVGSTTTAQVAYNRFGTGAATGGTIAGVGDLFVTEDLETGGFVRIDASDTALALNADGGDASVNICFYEAAALCGRTLGWDDGQNRFEMNDELATSGVLQAGTLGAAIVPYNRFGGGTAAQADISGPTDLLVTADLEVGETVYTKGTRISINDDGSDANQDLCFFEDAVACGESLLWDNTADEFVLSDQLEVDGNIQMNGQTLQLNADGPDGITVICFYETAACNEQFGWDDPSHHFEFTDDVNINGNLIVDLPSAATTNGLCHSGADADAAGAVDRTVVVCSAAPGDVAEWYETTGALAAEIVVATPETVTYTSDAVDPFTGLITPAAETLTASVLAPSTSAYQQGILGVVSTSPKDTMGKAILSVAEHPAPIAVAGRVPVKVSAMNGAIAPGDPITSSPIPGVGMKATEAGPIVGYALDHFAGEGVGSVLVYVQPGTYVPADAFEQLQSENDELREEIGSLAAQLAALQELVARLVEQQ